MSREIEMDREVAIEGFILATIEQDFHLLYLYRSRLKEMGVDMTEVKERLKLARVFRKSLGTEVVDRMKMMAVKSREDRVEVNDE